MKTFLKTQKEKKAFIIAALVLISFFAISLFLTGKANAATGINAAGKANAATTIKKGYYCIRTKAAGITYVNLRPARNLMNFKGNSVRKFEIQIVKDIKSGSRISVILAYLGKPTLITQRPYKLYYCNTGGLCMVFSFVHSRLTEKAFREGKFSHYKLAQEKILQIAKR
jgi:hypothetical protein